VNAEHREYVVDDRTAARMASVAVRFGFTPRRSLLVVALLVVATTLGGGITAHGIGYVAGAVAGLVLVALLYRLQRRQARIMLAGRGYRPGDTIASEFGDDGFTVTAATGTAHHPYSDIGRMVVYDEAVAMWLRTPRYVVVLPRPLVPDDRQLSRPR
jgi:hypothetical protein